MTERERMILIEEPRDPALGRLAAPNADRRQVAAGVLLGVGLGGLFDGIVLHQILQWHHLVSSPFPPTSLANLEINTLADGLFHAATWIATLAGVLLLAGRRDARGRLPAPRVLIGALLAGWGASTLSRASSTTICSACTTSGPAPASSGGTWAFWPGGR